MELVTAFLIAIFVSQCALLGASLAFCVKYTTLALSYGYNAPYVPTHPEYFEKIAGALEIKVDDIVYDLGCGDGRLILFCARREPHAQFIGIERNRLLVAYARTRKLMTGNPSNVSFRCKDFFDVNFSEATCIYSYLLPQTVNALFSRRNLTGVRLISRAFPLYNRTPTEVIRLSQKDGSHGEHLLYAYKL
ncbi:MAG: class I SAM-dependent methyltransferase [bacterium]|nr:class I SAM-dependent methyltransferase [bacterium]